LRIAEVGGTLVANSGSHAPINCLNSQPSGG
jgi:hypothetical protein